jgi:hypothetical protein
MYCAYSQQALPIIQQVLCMQSTSTAYKSTGTVYTVNRHCLLINMYCAYSQQALPINQQVLCMQSTSTAY